MNASPPQFLQAGELVFRPGGILPTITSTRAELAQQLLRGKPAALASRQLPLLYTLCGCAHGLTAAIAVDVATGVRNTVTDNECIAIATETAREHVRRIWLDWPRLMGPASMPVSITALRDCPLLHRDATGNMPDSFLHWITEHVLGEDADQWLVAWEDNPVQCMTRWVSHADTLPAVLLGSVAKQAQSQHITAEPLLPHRDMQALWLLAQHIVGDDNFSQLPSGDCLYETGVWTRLALAGKHYDGMTDSWLRLGARIAELVRLASAPQTTLSIGALALGHGEAIAWCEMARGLLIHRVRLQDDVKGGALMQIADYRIVAPTEWNFHPYGVVAQMLATLPKTDAEETVAQVGILAAAFDPCVNYRIGCDHA